MSDGGWIALYRKLEDSPVFQNPNLLQTFVKVLLRAAYKPMTVSVPTGRGTTSIQLKPGELTFSRNAWGKEVGRCPKSVQRDVLELERQGMISRENRGHFTLLRVANWDVYQCPGNVQAKSRQTSEKLSHQKTPENTGNNGDSAPEAEECVQANSSQIHSDFDESCPGPNKEYKKTRNQAASRDDELDFLDEGLEEDQKELRDRIHASLISVNGIEPLNSYWWQKATEAATDRHTADALGSIIRELNQPGCKVHTPAAFINTELPKRVAMARKLEAASQT